MGYNPTGHFPDGHFPDGHFLESGGGGDPPPSITAVDGDNSIQVGQLNIVVTGTDFNVTLGNLISFLQEGQGIDSAATEAVSATTLQFDLTTFDGRYGDATLLVVNDDIQSDSIDITITPQAGYAYVDITSVAGTGDHIDAVAVAVGNQLRWYDVVGGDETDVVVAADGTFTYDPSVVAFEVDRYDGVLGASIGSWIETGTQILRDAPSFAGPSITQANVHAGGTVIFGDPVVAFDASALFTVASGLTPTYSLVSASNGITINSTTGVLGGAFEDVTAHVRVLVTDQFGRTAQSNSLSFDIHASEPPVFTGTIGDQEFTTGQVITPVDLSTYFSDADEETGLYFELVDQEVIGLPPGLTLDADTGELSGTPSAAGTYPVTVYCEDSTGEWVESNVFNIIVSDPVGAAFVGPAINNFSRTVDVAIAPISYANRFAASAPMTFTAVGTLPTGLSLSSAGVLTGTPTVVGSYPGISIRADDGDVTADSNQFTITIAAVSVGGTLTGVGAVDVGDVDVGRASVGGAGVSG